MSKIYGVFENVSIERHLNLIVIALIRKNGGKITLTIDEIKSISLKSEIEETIHDNVTFTIKEANIV
jgi:hypothetical protein